MPFLREAGLRGARGTSCLLSSRQRFRACRAFAKRTSLVTLERAVGTNLHEDQTLWNTGCFDAAVYPDLPSAMTLFDWIKKVPSMRSSSAVAGGPNTTTSMSPYRHRHWGPEELIAPDERKQHHQGARRDTAHHGQSSVLAPPPLLVRTVACQSQNEEQLRRNLTIAAGGQHSWSSSSSSRTGVAEKTHPSPQRANALLILSGSCPSRRLPIWMTNLFQGVSSPPTISSPSSLSPLLLASTGSGSSGGRRARLNSTELLRIARQMKEYGELPSDLELWAVSNPMADDLGSLERKVTAGASVVLTQPALIKGRYVEWLARAHAAGITEAAAIVTGIPVLSSARNARFWGFLCGVGGHPDVEKLARTFADREEQGIEVLNEYREAWCTELVAEMERLEGLAGIHVMATTKPARETALTLARRGVFNWKRER